MTSEDWCWVGMTSLCYPYGAGITCVCDEPGRIYKCFPDLKSELASHASTKPRPNTASLADTLAGLDPDTVDRRSALVVTSPQSTITISDCDCGSIHLSVLYI